MDHLRRIIEKELPLFLQWLYRQRISANLNEMRITELLDLYSRILGRKILRVQTTPTRPWQHCYWTILHATGFYLSEKKDKYLNINFAKIMRTFDEVIPCGTCQVHYASQKEDVSWQLYAGVDPGLVMIKLHNSVSAMLNKPRYSIQQVCDMYGVLVDGRNNIPAFSYETYLQEIRKLTQANQMKTNLKQLR